MTLSTQEMAQRIAMDLPDGCYVNLGVGIPTLVAGYLPPEKEIILQSENGILGMGPPPTEEEYDPDLVDAGKQPTTLLRGAAIFDSLDSFTMLRGGHVDVAIMGAYQVSQRGDLANWKLPGASLAGIGGAADIAVGAAQLFVAMKHITRDGQPKIVKECTYSLTARGVVSRIYSDLAIIEVKPEGLLLVEVAPGVEVAEVKEKTGAPLQVAENLREIQVAGPK
jgi:3-oxoacid CoA-transferase B subunit